MNGGGDWGDYGSSCPFLSSCHQSGRPVICFIVFSTNNTPPQHISNLYYLTPTSSSSPIYLLFSSPTPKTHTNFPHIPNNTHNYSFSLSTPTTGQLIKSPTHSVPNLHVAMAVSNARKMNVVRKSSHPKPSLLLTFMRKRRSVKICKCYLNHMGS